MTDRAFHIVPVKIKLADDGPWTRWREPPRLGTIKLWMEQRDIKPHYDKTRRLSFIGDYQYIFDDRRCWGEFALPIDLAIVFKLTFGGV